MNLMEIASWAHGIDTLGYLAAGLVFLTFCMKTLIPLRLVAISSNLVFIIYAYQASLMPVLVLHAALLPLNILRAWQQIIARRRVLASARGNAHVQALVPFMRRLRCKTGKVLFLKGDRASNIYYLVSGSVDVPEVGKTLAPGTLFGEIGLFTPDRTRSASAVCVGPCEFLVISYRDIISHCMNDPAFGLFLTRLIVGRVVENEARSIPLMLDTEQNGGRP